MQTTPRLIEPSITSCSVSLIEPQEIHRFWPDVEPLLAPALDMTGGRMSAQTVFSWLAAGSFQLWIAGGDTVECAVVTEIRTYPTGLRTFNVLLLGGAGRERWLGLWPAMARWALERGCVKAEMTGRKGWLRVLDDWKETMTNAEVDLI